MMMIHSFSKSKLKTFNLTTHQKIKTRNKSSLPLHISSSSSSSFKVSNNHFKLSPLQQQSRLTRHNHIISNSHKQEEEGEEEEEEEEEENVRLRFIRGKKLLSELSTLGIGGPCNYFLQVSNQTQFLSAIRYCHEHSIRFIIIGKGSNCLFDDLGFNGCVILNRIEFVEVIEPGIYRVGSGYPFNRLGIQCSNEGFTGLEYAAGIPGTVGGATFMNAGANGQETSDAIYCVEIVTTDGRHETLNRKDITFRYRSSSLQHMEDMAGIIAVTFKLSPSVSAKKTQQTYLTRRRFSQPLGERSAGSVFKNPPPELGVSAGELIEQAGLKGCRVGGAMVSDIHANFFINCGNSTSKDMLELINIVKEKVDQKFGIKLKEEIQYIYPHQNI